ASLRVMSDRPEGRRGDVVSGHEHDSITNAVLYIVDDDPSVRAALARLVRSGGLQVKTFPSAKTFLDHPAPDRPACLVLDIRLPGPSGLDLQSPLTQPRPA